MPLTEDYMRNSMGGTDRWNLIPAVLKLVECMEAAGHQLYPDKVYHGIFKGLTIDHGYKCILIFDDDPTRYMIVMCHGYGGQCFYNIIKITENIDNPKYLYHEKCKDLATFDFSEIVNRF